MRFKRVKKVDNKVKAISKPSKPAIKVANDYE